MSLARAVLSTALAVSNQRACTPPNPTQQDCRYHTEEPWVLQIAPVVFKCHLLICWFCALMETVVFMTTFVSIPIPPILTPVTSFVCLPSTTPSAVRITPLYLIGVLVVLLGTYIRIDCFRTLGKLFTFDLTVHPKHKLITQRFYGYVRHPAYTGSLMLIAGLAFAHLSEGAWLTECGPLRLPGTAVVVWALWWAWALAVAVSRAQAEDKQMRKLFDVEWDQYAVQVPWWFFPGIL
ncbi:hypothetical protein AX17_001796 [Amanita inopinata Kibby_2008]|nr:hypothetical protein AX17_001796 [Amanita inopinata Kibby_2008]